MGVYVLHDVNDQDVPVEQARFMRNRLAEFHPNFVYFEQAGCRRRVRATPTMTGRR